MSRPSWRLGTLLVALFLLGAAAGYGVAVARFFHGHGPDSPSRHGRTLMIDRLDRELKFTPEQRDKVQAILDRKEQELKVHRREARREMVESREATRREIEVLLDDKQRATYDAMIERMRARRGPRDTMDAGR